MIVEAVKSDVRCLNHLNQFYVGKQIAARHS